MQVQREREDIARFATTEIKKVVTKTPNRRIPRERHGNRGVLLSGVYYSVKTLTIQAFLDHTLSQLLIIADISVERYVSIFKPKQYKASDTTVRTSKLA